MTLTHHTYTHIQLASASLRVGYFVSFSPLILSLLLVFSLQCKHAHVMKRIVDQMSSYQSSEGSHGSATQVDVKQSVTHEHACEPQTRLQQKPCDPLLCTDCTVAVLSLSLFFCCSSRRYMYIFLKFISSVIPTIEYDFTS